MASVKVDDMPATRTIHLEVTATEAQAALDWLRAAERGGADPCIPSAVMHLSGALSRVAKNENYGGN